MTKQIIKRAGRMHKPPHPGMVLREMHLKPRGLTVTDFADQIGMERKSVSRLVNERCSVSPEMALRLSKLLGTSADLWINLQSTYDLWHAEQTISAELKAIKPLPTLEMGQAAGA
tara:strand:- start:2520 stop:2864 length:345 start_codon:yes stop_codon:yes gene_type:complete